jgi:hypothetical protein
MKPWTAECLGSAGCPNVRRSVKPEGSCRCDASPSAVVCMRPSENEAVVQLPQYLFQAWTIRTYSQLLRSRPSLDRGWKKPRSPW